MTFEIYFFSKKIKIQRYNKQNPTQPTRRPEKTEMANSDVQIARLSFRSFTRPEDLIRLREDIFPAITGHFLATNFRIETPNENVQFSKCMIIADSEALRQFENWNCRLKVLRLFYANPEVMNPYVLYVGMNDLYEQNPNLKEEAVKENLEQLISFATRSNVIKKTDITEISILFKRFAWFAFINLSESLNEHQVAFVYTWLKENNYQLPNIDEKERIFVRYAKKDSHRERN